MLVQWGWKLCPKANPHASKLSAHVQEGSYLEEVDIAVGIAQAEDVLLFGVFRDGLHNAVLGKEGIAGGQVLLGGALAVRLVEQQRAA